MNDNKQLRTCGSKTYTFSFTVIDAETTIRLEGATFELRSLGLTIATSESDVDGLVTFEEIGPGEYTLHQTISPAGYFENPEVYDVIVRGCDRTTINGMRYRNFTVENQSNIFTLEYNPNIHSTDLPITQDIVYGTVINVMGNSFTTEYDNEFYMWNTAIDGTGVYYQPNDTLEILDDITLYAIFKSLDPTVNVIVVGDNASTGTGIEGSTVKQTYPNGDSAETTVGIGGTWDVTIPITSLPLVIGQQIVTIQTQENMIESEEIITTVE